MCKKNTFLIALLLTNFFAFSQVSLQITEIWPGNENGENLTANWFEITNNGDTAWTPSMGDLYFDDDSQDFSTADLINDISAIQPGESVIAINDVNSDEFISVWGSVYNLTGIQIRYF